AAFPSKRGFEVKELARKSFMHFGMILSDLSKASRYGVDWFYERSEIYNTESMVKSAKRENKGAVILLAHFGVWEALGTMAKKENVRIKLIVRALSNKYLNNYLTRVREKFPVEIYYKRGAVSSTLSFLKSKETVAILADQRAGGRGVFVDFFGRPASTVATPAVLALRADMPMFPGFAIRVGTSRFKLYVGNKIDISGITGSFDEKVFKITQLYASIVEEEVKKHPEQYFWMHRRWKSVPRKGALTEKGRVK
ncbi:MAG: lysophospholipid acyltransferase family protein, partial [Candidatus Auribacterota bacterium]|nr:lysophospholipid acyltransferase family protein [Candidatus Auribacterota bacterium]